MIPYEAYEVINKFTLFKIGALLLNEAVVGYLNAFQLSGGSRYLAAAAKTWDFIETRLIDRKQGEWFRGVTRDGRVIESFEKAGFWKCPYHNGRMGLEVVLRLRGKQT